MPRSTVPPHATADPQALEAAYRTWRARQDRTAHPAGHTDRGGRWYPADDEYRPCCDQVRSPSRAYPWSLMLHCRSITHVAALHGVPAAALRAHARSLQPSAAREGGDHYYKAVAVVNGRFLSIFDGTTEYRIGETAVQRPRQGHRGGIYVYPSLEAAAHARVPADSVLADAPRAILRVRAEGSYCRYDNGKLAFSQVTPLEVVAAPNLALTGA
jgi:hypothetical protein